MDIVFIPIKKLKLNEKNPRKITDIQFEKLLKNIQDDPDYFQMRPCLVNETENGMVVYAGNQRLRAAKKLGMKEIPCIVVKDVKEDLIKKRVVLDNVHHGEHDYDMLSSLYDPVELISLGMLESELHIDATTLIEGEDEDESEVLEPGKDEDAITKLGDVYELNNHRIVCGSSLDFNYFQKLMNDKKCDLLCTDPPYNFASENQLIAKDCSISFKNLKNSEWDKNFDPKEFLNNVFIFLNENCSVYVFTSHHLAPDIWFWMKSWADHHSWCIWSKSNPMPSLMKRHWTWNAELVCYATRGKHIFNFPKQGHALCVWDIHKENPTENHPTQKPLEVISHILKHSSNENSLILDPFLGSGTTLIAAEKLNRICYGIELSPEYVDIIVNRWKNYMEKNRRQYTIKRNGEPINGNLEGKEKDNAEIDARIKNY